MAASEATSVLSPGFGCLHTYVPQGNALERVRARVATAYREAGLHRVKWTEASRAIDELLGGGRSMALSLNPEKKLGEDEVFVVEEGGPGWIAIASYAWELAPPAQHPLALALSKAREVFSISCVEEEYAEYALYRGGRAVNLSLAGPRLPAVTETLPEIDFSWLIQRVIDVPLERDELKALLPDPKEFCRLTGLDALGQRDMFEAAPLADYDPESFLIFRRPA